MKIDLMNTEIYRLRQHLMERKSVCTRMADEINQLRKEAADDAIRQQSERDKFTNEIGLVRQKFADKKIDLIIKYHASLGSWTEKSEQMAGEIDQLRKEVVNLENNQHQTMNTDVGLLRQQLDLESTKNVEKETEFNNQLKRWKSMMVELDSEFESFDAFMQCKKRRKTE